MDDLAMLDATAQAVLVRDGTVKAVELVEAAITRIERVDGEVNAVITRRFDRALDEAAGDLPDGPFRGVPLLLKDLHQPSAGDPYYEGMGFLRDLGWVADHDGYFPAALRAAGAVLCGRTNTPEWGSVPTTEPLAFGPTRNPWDRDRSAGGSSGGSAAAVAAGMAPIATASDGGGSIRVPASACGLVGLKPTRARVSFGPDQGEGWAGCSVLGFVTRSVRDTASLLDATAGPEAGDPYQAPPLPRPLAEEVGADPGQLRVGVLDEIPASDRVVDAACVAATDHAARLLDSLGHRVERSFPEALEELDVVRRHFGRITSTAAAADFDRWRDATGDRLTLDDLEPNNREIVERGQRRTGVTYLQAVNWLHGWSRRAIQWWTDGFDLLLTPVMPAPPLPLGSMEPTLEDPLRGLRTAGEVVCFTSPFNITGQPAISLPLHWTDDGLPVGVQLVAAPGREDLLIRVASQLEQAQPWADRRPPLHA